MGSIMLGLALGAFVFSSLSAAYANDRTWIFTGSELIAAFKGDFAPEASDKEQKRSISAARGQAYVSGVADALQEREWCGAGSILPHEIVDRVITYLTDLPSERLEENAATLVGQALSQKFPCNESAKKP